MLTVLRCLVGSFVVLVLFVILGSLLLPTPAEPRAYTDRDICAWRAGIRRDTPLMYETTKVLYYGGYVQCMLDCGHPILPLP